MEAIDQFVEAHGAEQRQLIPLLLAIQQQQHYLPREALEQVAQRLNLPLIRVVQVAAFYRAFSLTPRGKHQLTVCAGTACHVRGGDRLLDHLQRTLKVAPGETTPDRQFTLEAVNCLGCCALAPVLVLDGKYYGVMSASKAGKVLAPLMDVREDPEHEPGSDGR